MLNIALKIIGTIFLGISALLAIARHWTLLDDEPGAVAGSIIWSLAWRGYVIAVLWII